MTIVLDEAIFASKYHLPVVTPMVDRKPVSPAPDEDSVTKIPSDRDWETGILKQKLLHLIL